MSELGELKSSINLTEYAASLGYLMDRRASSRNSVVMRHGNGDKIVIARGHDAHWIYFSVRDDTDNGTIVDFVQHRKGCKEFFSTVPAIRNGTQYWCEQGQ